MKSNFITIFLVLYMILSVNGQDLQNEKFILRNSFELGVGIIGLLSLDELRIEQYFDRRAWVPLNLQYQRKIKQHLIIGYYVGYEYEEQSGTFSDFQGPNHSIVTGPTLDVSLFKFSRKTWFNPYIGFSYFFYRTSTILEGFFPGFRVGFNITILNNLSLEFNAGVGAALLESNFKLNF